jgi:iron complex outermembrane receptor protein
MIVVGGRGVRRAFRGFIMRRPLLALLALSASTFALAAPAGAQDLPAVDEAAGAEVEQPGSEILVIGSRAQGRTVASSPVPIDVISGDQIANSGYTETNKVLNQLVPSFNFPQPSITDGTDTVRPATLRGLSPDQTLVLINGKRRHTTALLNINGSVGRGAAAVDLNMIPAIAIGRVEVLRDGAAAQYGSDAIAGVINFQLAEKRDFSGRVTVTHGYYDTRTNGVQGFASVASPATGAPTLAPDGTLAINTTGKDRHVTDGATTTVAATIGLPIAQQGYFDVSAEYQTRNPTNRTGFDPRQQYDLIGGSLDPREFTFDRYNHRYGDAKTQDLKLFVNAGVPLGPNVKLYAFGSYNFRDGESAAFYRRPIAADGRNIAAIYPDGFLPLINTTLEDFAGTTGVKGEIGNGFRYDLSIGTAENKFDFQINNTLNRSFGPSSPTSFDSGGLRYSQTVANLDLSKEVAIGGLSSVTLAAGAEYRRETFRLRPGNAPSYQGGNFGGASGAQGFPGISPTIGGQRVDQLRARHNVSAYAEIDVEVNDMFTLQGAGRYEDYSDFGSDWNGKLAGRFEPVDGFALRGAVSTGFRAPSLQQQFFSASATNNVNGLLLETLTVPIDNPIAIALGATPLKAENSVSYSAGAVFTAIPRVSLTVDAYQVSIDDRIVVTDNLTATRTAGAPSGSDPGLSIARILNAAGFNNTNAARFFVNGVDTRTRGIDAVLTYRADIGGGRANFTAGYNYNETKIRRILAAPGPIANIPGLVLFGRQESLRLTDGQPRTKLNFALDYDHDWIGFNVRTNRYGKTLAAGTDAFTDVPLEAKWITDAEIRAKVLDRIDLAIGANNVFDVYPTETPSGRGIDPVTGAGRNYGATNYVTPYSSFSPFGFNGRYLYARVGVSF